MWIRTGARGPSERNNASRDFWERLSELAKLVFFSFNFFRFILKFANFGVVCYLGVVLDISTQTMEKVYSSLHRVNSPRQPLRSMHSRRAMRHILQLLFQRSVSVYASATSVFNFFAKNSHTTPKNLQRAYYMKYVGDGDDYRVVGATKLKRTPVQRLVDNAFWSIVSINALKTYNYQQVNVGVEQNVACSGLHLLTHA